MLLLFGAAASAAELVPGLVLPGATALPAGEGQAAIGALVFGGATPTAAVTLRGAVGITDRLAVQGALQEPGGGLALGLRYNVLQSDTFRFAPFVVGAVDDALVTEAPADPAMALGAAFGIALEGGSKAARLDLSLPLVATGVNPLEEPLLVPLRLGSAGLTVQVTPRHALRVCVEPTGAVGLGARYVRERWYLQGTGAWSVLREAPLGAAEVGLRF